MQHIWYQCFLHAEPAMAIPATLIRIYLIANIFAVAGVFLVSRSETEYAGEKLWC
jgi:hypothetical protein